MPTATFGVYDFDPYFTISRGVGGVTVYSEEANASGTATITDINGLIEDIDFGETATATITVGGNTSTNVAVEAEEAWTLRDVATGQEFQIITLRVTAGDAQGYYTLSEAPLIAGRSYETVAFTNDPDDATGTVFNFNDYVSDVDDGTVSGTAGDDVIDTTYLGDPQGEEVDNSDSLGATPPTDLRLNWTDRGADEDDLSAGFTVDTGGIEVTLSTLNENSNATFEVETRAQYVAGDTFGANSSLELRGTGGTGDTGTATIDFAATGGSGFNDEVVDLRFRINDIDTSGWQDIVAVRAFDANGNAVTVDIEISGNETESGGVVTAGAGGDNPNQAAGSVFVRIDGPVQRVEIDYGNLGTAGQAIYVTDLLFQAVTPGGDDDVIDAGAGNDSIDAGIDNDTVFGGTGDDTMAAGQGDDSFYGGEDRDTLVLSDGFGADTFEGGEGGTDTDVIDASALSAGVTATLTGNEVGTLTDGTDTVTFAEVETLTLTDQNDTLDASAAAAPVTVNAGAGDDTLTGGTGADSLGGGAGDDTFALVDGFGGDTITGDETAETVGDTLYASAVTGDTAVALSGDGEGTLTNGTDTANFDGIEIIETGAGDDTINAAADTAGLTLTGGDGDDSITGGAGDDLITGDGGTSAASGAWTYSYWDLDPTGDPRTLAQAGFTENGGRDHADVPTETGFTDVIDPTAFDTADDYALKFTTALEVNTGGTYTFATTSDDGSKMYINGVEVVDNDGHHGAITRTGTVDLSPGTHIIEIVYYENNGGNSLSATLSGPDTGGSTTALTGYGGLTAPRDPGNDTLDGGAGADTIFAGDGADTVRLSDGFGDDTIFGGDGGEDTDTLDLSGLSQGIDITLSANEDGTATAAGDTATFDDIEAFLLTDAADTFAGGAATDGLTLDAGAGDDRVTGGAGADRIALGAGDDTARIGQGDSVSGGDGDDIFTLTDTTGAGTVTIIGGEGDETAGDTLDFSGLLDKGSIVITDDDDASGGISGYGFLTDGTRVEFSEIETIICFARGTGILTHAGEKRVERLRAGDQVMTLDRGLQTVRWVGSRRVAATGNLAPIVIAAGTFGNCRDLVVSPQHRMVIEGPKAELLFGESQVLVPAKHLLTWDGVYRRSGGTVEYYHLLFDGHEIIYADGALAESFHPGNQALSSVEADAKAEILALFPNLAEDTATYGPPARVSLRGYEAEVLGRALAN